jgi:hypothetical protein
MNALTDTLLWILFAAALGSFLVALFAFGAVALLMQLARIGRRQ